MMARLPNSSPLSSPLSTGVSTFLLAPPVYAAYPSNLACGPPNEQFVERIECSRNSSKGDRHDAVGNQGTRTRQLHLRIWLQLPIQRAAGQGSLPRGGRHPDRQRPLRQDQS